MPAKQARMRAYLASLAVVAASVAMLLPDRSPDRSGDRSTPGNVASDTPDRVAQTTSSSSVEIARSVDGHFYADVLVNGAPIRMVVDTGASSVALSREDASVAAVLAPPPSGQIVGKGASGDVHGALVTINRISVGQVTSENLPAVVLDDGKQSLLGENMLAKFRSVQINGDVMILTPA